MQNKDQDPGEHHNPDQSQDQVKIEQEFLTWNINEVLRLSAKTGTRPHTQLVDTCDQNSGIEILIKIQAILNKNF